VGQVGLALRSVEMPTARAFVPLLAPARDKVARGGRGSGKSHFFAGLMVEDSLAEPGECGGQGLLSACLREVQKDLAQSAKRLIENKLIDHRLGEADGFKVYEDCIATPSDGLIIFKGMNNYTADSIKSLEGFKRAWWEEAHTGSLTSINLLRPTMRTPGSQMHWSYNRNKKTDAVDAMFSGPEIPTGAVVVDANWRDNPWFTPELEQERQDCLRMQPDQYDHIWDGGYISVVAGAYFAKNLTEARAQGRISRVSADPLMTIRAVWDIGGTGQKADATAIWIVQYVGREIRLLDYYEAVGQPLATHVAWLRDNGYGKALCVLPHDGAAHEKITDTTYEGALRTAGFEVRVIPNQGAGAAMQRVEAARRLFPQMWFDAAKCAGGLEAIGWYHEKRDEKRTIGLGPEHDWSSHGSDAFGLVAVAYEPPQQARTIEYTSRGIV
jgi:phage terminase large subunit